jgi:hypothetical protein
VFQFIPAIRRVSHRLPGFVISVDDSSVCLKEGRDRTSHQWLLGYWTLDTLDSLWSHCGPTGVSEN